MAQTRTLTIGLYDHAYLNTGTHDVPVWTEIDGVEDIDYTSKRAEVSAKLRRWMHEMTLLGQKQKELSFDLATEPANSVWVAFFNADLNGTAVEILLMYKGDSVTVGSKGHWLTVVVTKFDGSQKLEGVDVNAITVKPSPAILDGETVAYEPVVHTVA